MFSTGFKGVGLHYTAFADAICGDSRPTAASRGVSPRKKFAVRANVESRGKGRVVRRDDKLGLALGTISLGPIRENPVKVRQVGDITSANSMEIDIAAPRKRNGNRHLRHNAIGVRTFRRKGERLVQATVWQCDRRPVNRPCRARCPLQEHAARTADERCAEVKVGIVAVRNHRDQTQSDRHHSSPCPHLPPGQFAPRRSPSPRTPQPSTSSQVFSFSDQGEG